MSSAAARLSPTRAWFGAADPACQGSEAQPRPGLDSINHSSCKQARESGDTSMLALPGGGRRRKIWNDAARGAWAHKRGPCPRRPASLNTGEGLRQPRHDRGWEWGVVRGHCRGAASGACPGAGKGCDGFGIYRCGHFSAQRRIGHRQGRTNEESRTETCGGEGTTSSWQLLHQDGVSNGKTNGRAVNTCFTCLGGKGGRSAPATGGKDNRRAGGGGPAAGGPLPAAGGRVAWVMGIGNGAGPTVKCLVAGLAMSLLAGRAQGA